MQNNTSANARTAALTIAGQTVQVTQPPFDPEGFLCDVELGTNIYYQAPDVIAQASVGPVWGPEGDTCPEGTIFEVLITLFGPAGEEIGSDWWSGPGEATATVSFAAAALPGTYVVEADGHASYGPIGQFFADYKQRSVVVPPQQPTVTVTEASEVNDRIVIVLSGTTFLGAEYRGLQLGAHQATAHRRCIDRIRRDKWRENYGQQRNINSAYRNPARNNAAGGAAASRHMFGDAVDMDVATNTAAEWQDIRDALVEALPSFIEPQSGPCGLGCVHGDWRYVDGGYR